MLFKLSIHFGLFSQPLIQLKFVLMYVEKSVKQLYKDQWETIARILKSDELADKIIPKDGKFKLNEGHLAPRGNFAFNVFQRATCNRINVMPQFNSINGGNWRRTEKVSFEMKQT